MLPHPYLAIVVSLGLGMLIGLQREWKKSDIAGIRTFPLISLYGCLSSLFVEVQGGWILAAGILSIAVLMLVSNVSKLQTVGAESGMTTETAALLMYVIGAAIGLGHLGPAIVTGGMMAVLLHWKKPLHSFVSNLGESDFRSIIHLVLIALVILPVLPNQTYGPYDVINPYKIWLMVVLIVGISMTAYVAFRILGPKAGSIVGGVLGGFISSTATTVSYARLSKNDDSTTSVAALVITIASAIVNLRVLIEIGVVSPSLLRAAWVPIAILLGIMLLEAIAIYAMISRAETEPPKHDNPTQFHAAIIFGLLYAVILFVVAVVRANFGNQALYVVAAVSGLTDVDAITLSTAELYDQGTLPSDNAWRIILIAIMSNLLFKTAAVMFLGNRKLRVYIVTIFGLAFAAGLVLFWSWPTIE